MLAIVTFSLAIVILRFAQDDNGKWWCINKKVNFCILYYNPFYFLDRKRINLC